jgi:hypothetical protein
MKNPILQLTFISQRDREREKKKERKSAKDLPAAAIPFSWPAAFYSLPEL